MQAQTFDVCKKQYLILVNNLYLRIFLGLLNVANRKKVLWILFSSDALFFIQKYWLRNANYLQHFATTYLGNKN